MRKFHPKVSVRKGEGNEVEIVAEAEPIMQDLTFELLLSIFLFAYFLFTTGRRKPETTTTLNCLLLRRYLLQANYVLSITS